MNKHEAKRIDSIKNANPGFEVELENFPIVLIHNRDDDDALIHASVVVEIGPRGGVKVIGGRNEDQIKV